MRQALFKFEVKSLMFDVDGLKFKAIASNVIKLKHIIIPTLTFSCVLILKISQVYNDP